MPRPWDALGPARASIRLTLADADLRRLIAAWFESNAGKWAFIVVTSVLAFSAGGAVAVGILGLAQFLPQMVVAPFAGLPTARWRPESVLRATFVIRALATILAAIVVAAALPIEALYVAVVIEACASVLVRPLHLSLLPAVARTPAQLVGSNVASSAAESLGTFVGPALASVLLVLSGSLAATVLVALIYAVGVAVIATVTVPTAGRTHAGARDAMRRLSTGFQSVVHDRGPRILFVCIGFQTLVRGALGVLIVVASVELLGLGNAGVGTLTAAIGFGGLLGAAVSTLLAGGGRLGNAFVAALVGWGAPIAIMGILVDPFVAIAAMLVVGLSNAVVDVTLDTLLQRLVPHIRQVAVIGLLELVISAGTAFGAVIAPAVISAFGIEGALVAVGAVLPVVALLSWPILRSVDESGTSDPHRVELLRSEPLFAPLSLASIEHLAACLDPVRFADGAWLMRQGQPGRSFYLIDQGSVEISRDGHPIRLLGPGTGCGEIALIDDVPRTASVQAIGQVEAFSLEREEFLEAIVGHAASRTVAGERSRTVRAADAERVALH